MSTGFKTLCVIRREVEECGLEMRRVPKSDPVEYRIHPFHGFVAGEKRVLLFQGDEDRVSDFLTGWIAAIGKYGEHYRKP